MQAFDPAEHLLADPISWRSTLANRGISVDPYLILDYSKVLTGGLNTRSDSFRQRFNLPIQVDTKKLFGLHGGTFAVIYQHQHGGNASQTLAGDYQNFDGDANADGRSQIGQLWYQQRFFDDTFRLRLGKIDVNSDFEAPDNTQEFLNNSFQTSSAISLYPTFPDSATGVQLFYEPKSAFYAGAGVFDGSQARGVHTGEYGPGHFFDRPADLFTIAEIGQRFEIDRDGRKFPGRVAGGVIYDTNKFRRLDGNGTTTATSGVYAMLDQLLWRPSARPPVPAGPPLTSPNAQPQEEEFPSGISFSGMAVWSDPLVNSADVSVLGAFEWIGAVPNRKIDVLGLGATYAHFSGAFPTRDDYELAIETFYRLRITRWVSIKPDLQYIIHPTGSGFIGQPLRHDALVLTMRMEISF